MPEFRLHELLLFHYQQVHHKNLTQFLKAINDASEQAGSTATISYHALHALLHNPFNAALNWANLEPVHYYLSLSGQGLDEQPIFAGSSIVDDMVRSQQILYLVPCKPCDKARTDHVSVWDLRCQFKLDETMREMRPRSNFKFETELVGNPTEYEEAELVHIRGLLSKGNCFVSPGSSMVSLSSELMLADMFGLKPFTPPPPHPEAMPCYFIWSPKKLAGLRSCLTRAASDLPASEAKLAAAIKAGTACAVQVGNRFYRVSHDQPEWLMYGLIAVQRRAQGHLWVVLSGISGPATLAAASLLKDIKQSLPYSPGKNSPVLHAVVEAKVKVNPAKLRGDNRTVESCRFLTEPSLWPAASARTGGA